MKASTAAFFGASLMSLVMAGGAYAEGNWGIVTAAYLKLTGGTLTGPVVFPDGTASAPGIAFDGGTDNNTGFYQTSDDVIGVATNGSLRFSFNGLQIASAATNGPAVRSVTNSSTVPGFLPFGNTASGVGAIDANSVDLIGASVSGLRVTSGKVVKLDLPAGASVAGTCTQGDLAYDTDVTEQICFCVSTNTWKCAALGALD